MDTDIKHHSWLSSLCDWTSSIRKRSPLPLLTWFLCPVTTIVLTNDTRLNDFFIGLENTLNFTTTSSQLCVHFCKFCIFPPFFESAYLLPLSLHRVQEDQDMIKKRLFSSCFLMLSIKINPWEYLWQSVIADSSHREAMQGLVLTGSEQYASSPQLFG